MKKFIISVLFFSTLASNVSFALGLKSFNFSKKEKEKTSKTVPDDTTNKPGYAGTLPDVQERFKKFQPQEAKPPFEFDEQLNNNNGLKSIPRDDPAFINIIMKKDKTSQYMNDLTDIIELLDKLETLIEDKCTIQVFNAKAFYIDKSVEYFRDKYQNRAESSFISFKQLMELNSQIQAVARLREEGEIYSPYVTSASSGNVFSKNNIDNQLEYLLVNLRKTLINLKEVR